MRVVDTQIILTRYHSCHWRTLPYHRETAKETTEFTSTRYSGYTKDTCRRFKRNKRIKVGRNIQVVYLDTQC